MRPSSIPSTKILPRVGFSSRIRRRTRVDLPAPEGPTRKRKSPSGTSRLMSRRAWVPVGYVLKTCWKLMTGRVSKSGVKTISCISCCGVTRLRARMARSRAVYPMPPAAPTPSQSVKHRFNGRRLRPLRELAVLAQAPAQPGLDEGVDLTVQHRRRVPDLQAGPDVFDQRVRLQDVVPDLGAELGRHDLAPDLVQVLGSLLLLALEQPRLEDLHRHLAVLHLRPLVLAGDDDAGGQVCDPDGRVRLVDVMASRTGRPVGIDPDVLRVDHDGVRVRVLELWHHLDEREGRVASMVLVERRDAHQAVYAVL